MQMNTKFNIEEFLSLKGYDNETRKNRRKGNGGTQEFFTPFSLVKKICEMVSEDDWKDPEKTFLDPCMGNGQFIIYVIYRRLILGIELYDVLRTVYGVELMPDNVKSVYERIYNLLDSMQIEYDKAKVKRIMKKNLVCSDFFKWDFEHWKPIEETKSIALF